MTITPNLEEVKAIAATGEYNVLPVSCELLSDICTPIEAMRILKNVSTHCFLLESVAEKEKWGRYTFLGFDPKMEITCSNGEMQVGSLKFHTEDPAAALRQILSEYKSPKMESLPSFTGGLVGYFSYDFLGYSEPSVRMQVQDTEDFKDVDLMLFDKVICFDNLKQQIILITNASTENLEESYPRAVAELEEMAELIRQGQPAKIPPLRLKSEFRPLFTQKQYCAMVEKARHYIREGDIFQVVLSNRLEADCEGSLLDTYRLLRVMNPSPYMFYFSSDDIEIAHAVAYAKKIVPQMDKDEIVVITLSGRGDKDCVAIARYRGEDIHE